MLIIKKNGILLNKEKQDVTDNAFLYLSELVELDEEVTLKDLFIIIEKNIDIFHLIFGNWLKEHVVEGLYGAKDENLHTLCVNYKLEHVALTWELSLDNDELNIPFIPNFNGHSIAQENDEYYEKGQVINWALDFTPVQNYIDCVFKLNKNLFIYNKNTDTKVYYKTNDFTLYQIILGVLWEISFLGSPLDRDQKRKEINNQLEDIKSGKIEIFPLEDVLADLKLKIDDTEEL